MSRAAFELLGLPDDATLTQVRAAYRLKAAEHHPDIGGDAAEFVRLREAYETAYQIAENAPCEFCEGKGRIGTGQNSFAKLVMRCAACRGTGKREH